MSREIYNLQVPINSNLANELKRLADEDDRTLRAYCRRILQDYVNNLDNKEKSSTEINNPDNKEKNIEIITEKSLKLNKSKVKGF